MSIQSPLNHPKKKRGRPRKKKGVTVMNNVTVQDVFLRFYEDFCKLYPASSQQTKTALCIIPKWGRMSVYAWNVIHARSTTIPAVTGSAPCARQWMQINESISSRKTCWTCLTFTLYSPFRKIVFPDIFKPFKELLNLCYGKEWISYIKPAFNGAQSVINYLGDIRIVLQSATAALLKWMKRMSLILLRITKTKDTGSPSQSQALSLSAGF